MATKKKNSEKEPEAPPAPDSGDAADALARNLTLLFAETARVADAYLKPREEGQRPFDNGEGLAETIRTISQVASFWLSEPVRALEAQNRLMAGYIGLWAASLQRMSGEPSQPFVSPDDGDKRFKDPDWSQNQFYDFVKQFYLVTSRWALEMVRDAEGLDDHTRHKADFYVRQLVSALSPSNFVFTNPELLRTTLTENASNLVRGVQMLAEDIRSGGGELKIRQSDRSKFELGVNIATTPGKVVFQNDLCQLIQYEPTTGKVFKRPLLIVPPWINKYYILDLTPEKSFIRWAVEQGHTVFVISWVNPDERHADKCFASYMHEGVLAALDAVCELTNVRDVNAIGYCIGGTLLSATLAWMTARKDTRIRSATLFAAQVDFTHAGELKVFIDEPQISALERQMAPRGYLEGGSMATAFNMLRPNDLIWPYVISNYFKGQQPSAFDLLHWNSDSTRIPAANCSFYLRQCYLENTLAAGNMVLDGVQLDLKKVKVPVFSLATREDHIAPARSVFLGSSHFGGSVEFVLAGSGHIAGVINPPARNKYQYWTGAAPRGDGYATWLTRAEEHSGSWWPHWQAWIEKQNATRVKARAVKKGLELAPGSYVKVMS